MIHLLGISGNGINYSDPSSIKGVWGVGMKQIIPIDIGYRNFNASVKVKSILIGMAGQKKQGYKAIKGFFHN